MTEQDWISLIAVIIPCMAGLIAWLTKHAERLQRAEVRIEGIERKQSDDIQWIRSALLRIEDKLDNKVDRP